MKTNKSKLSGWIILILGVIMAIRTGTNVYQLWKAGDQVIEQKKAVAAAKMENEQLKRELARVEDPATIEKEARDKLGYGREGEQIVIIPKNNNQAPIINNQGEKELKNWEKWWRLYVTK